MKMVCTNPMLTKAQMSFGVNKEVNCLLNEFNGDVG
jgi:hypothetical protein